MTRLMLAFLALFFSFSVWAGGTAVIGTDDANEQATLEYADGKIRLSSEQQDDGYMLVDGDRVYAVTYENGQPMVLDMATMGKMLGAMGSAAGQMPLQLEKQIGEIVELRSLNRSETHAGIAGQLHELVYLDAEGNRHTEEVVLSRDPAAQELTRTMLQLSRTLAAVFAQPVDPLDAFGQMLLKDKQGLLRIGDEMRLIALDSKTPSAERFLLPAEPGSMPDFGALMKEATRKMPEAIEALGDFMEALEELGNR